MTAIRQQAATTQSGKSRLASRVRILPLTILAVALLLGLKIGSLWQGRAELFVTPAGAQQQGTAQRAGQPTQLTPPPAAAQTAQAPAQVPAQAPAQPQSPAPAASAMPATPAAPTAAPSSTVQSLADRDPTTFTRAEIELLANLAQRRDQLEQRAREIDLRESLLAAAEKRIDERIAELKKLEGSIKQIVQQYDKQEEQNLQGLVKVYENMKPKDAARIFEKLDANVLLGVVERMKEAKLAAVLADMSPATAQDITVRLATRKQIPPSLRAGAETQIQPAPTAPAAATAPGAAPAAPSRPAGTGG
ncbi:MAG: MotE family protein [Ferrovibrio sp.]|uniref:MotE family protein n=1 Tax=Ferrovibrio sp. TaxID=1917215 RepID=UPI00391B2456